MRIVGLDGLAHRLEEVGGPPTRAVCAAHRWQVLTAGRSLLFFDAHAKWAGLPDTANRTRYTFAGVSDFAVHYLQVEHARHDWDTPTPRTGTALRDSRLTHRVSLSLARVTELKRATVAWSCRCHGQAEQSGSGRTSQPC